MSTYFWAVLICAAAGPDDVTVMPLRGTPVTAKLVGVSEQQVQVETANGPQTFEAASLQSVQAGTAAVAQPPAESGMTVKLVDGSTLAATAFRVHQSQATIELMGQGKLEVPTQLIRFACFGKQDVAVQKQWQEIVETAASADMIVVRKVTAGGGADGSEAANVALDHLQGILSDIDPETVGFEFEGQQLKVPRRKVEGIVYFRAKSAVPEPACRLIDAAGSTWSVRSLKTQGGSLELVTTAGVHHTMPLSQWAKIDYSAGNLVFVNELQPEVVQWQPYVESSAIGATLSKWFQPRWNGSIYGGALLLGGQSYERGLALHSRTLVGFRLTDSYQRFLATVGIDDRFRANGGVRLVISGENGVLLDKNIAGRDDPFEVDLDIRGVHRLQILVDFGDDHSDAGDHLNLCNARLMK